ncbi:alpha/beta fold hydrolase [Spongiibacter sp.]|uniref:alpha/beta fold hydrolase n=1 Tax=Spongiibacter sp. TaxID=2024860 RepID=UPI003568AD1C
MRSELKSAAATLYSESRGEGSAVVLLHGLFGSASNLLTLSRSLESHYRVIRMDLRNHGKSPHRDYMDIPTMALDVARTLDTLGIERAALLGHSLGGKVAMQLAATQPERVSRLVVADIAPVSYGRGHDAIIEGLLELDLRSLRNREQADALLQKAAPELPVRQFLLKNLVREGDGWAWRMNLPVIADCYDLLRDAPAQSPYRGPTLFIRGELSRYIVDDNRVGIMRQFPDSRLETIAGAGHWLHAERPREFNALVGDFLAEG